MSLTKQHNVCACTVPAKTYRLEHVRFLASNANKPPEVAVISHPSPSEPHPAPPQNSTSSHRNLGRLSGYQQIATLPGNRITSHAQTVPYSCRQIHVWCDMKTETLPRLQIASTRYTASGSDSEITSKAARTAARSSLPLCLCHLHPRYRSQQGPNHA